MDSNVFCWDVQCVSKFGYIILLEIPKETTNDWVNILGIERVWDVLIVIASVSFMIWVIPIQPACTLPWTILIWPKKENETMKMLELNITAWCPCMTLKMHLLKRVFHYLTISMDRTKWCLQSYYVHQVVGSLCTCLNHLGIRWEVEMTEISLIDNISNIKSDKEAKWTWFTTRITEKWSYWWNKMSVFGTKGKFVPTTVYCTYNKWKSCYEEILKILWRKMEAIHQILQVISLYGRVVSWFK